jgi:hypothetical protein
MFVVAFHMQLESELQPVDVVARHLRVPQASARLSHSHRLSALHPSRVP